MSRVTFNGFIPYPIFTSQDLSPGTYSYAPRFPDLIVTWEQEVPEQLRGVTLGYLLPQPGYDITYEWQVRITGRQLGNSNTTVRFTDPAGVSSQTYTPDGNGNIDVDETYTNVSLLQLIEIMINNASVSNYTFIFTLHLTLTIDCQLPINREVCTPPEPEPPSPDPGPSPDPAPNDDESNLTIYIVAGIGVLILLLVLGFAFLHHRRSRT